MVAIRGSLVVIMTRVEELIATLITTATAARLKLVGSGVIHPEPHHPAGTETKSYHPAYSGE